MYTTPLAGGAKALSGNISEGFAPPLAGHMISSPINLSKDGLTPAHLKINSFKNTRKLSKNLQKVTNCLIF